MTGQQGRRVFLEGAVGVFWSLGLLRLLRRCRAQVGIGVWFAPARLRGEIDLRAVCESQGGAGAYGGLVLERQRLIWARAGWRLAGLGCLWLGTHVERLPQVAGLRLEGSVPWLLVAQAGVPLLDGGSVGVWSSQLTNGRTGLAVLLLPLGEVSGRKRRGPAREEAAWRCAVLVSAVPLASFGLQRAVGALSAHRDHASHLAVEVPLRPRSGRQHVFVREGRRAEGGREHLVGLGPGAVPARRVLLHQRPAHALLELRVHLGLPSGVGARVAGSERGLDRGRVGRLAEPQVAMAILVLMPAVRRQILLASAGTRVAAVWEVASRGLLTIRCGRSTRDRVGSLARVTAAGA